MSYQERSKDLQRYVLPSEEVKRLGTRRGMGSLLQAGDAVLDPLGGAAPWAGLDRGVGAGLRETRLVLRLRGGQDLLRVAL